MRMVGVVGLGPQHGNRGRKACRGYGVVMGMLMEPAVCQPRPGQGEAENECKAAGGPGGPTEPNHG